MAGRGRGGLLQVGRRHREHTEHEPAAQLAAVTVTVAASTKCSADSALMASVHHLGLRNKARNGPIYEAMAGTVPANRLLHLSVQPGPHNLPATCGRIRSRSWPFSRP